MTLPRVKTNRKWTLFKLTFSVCLVIGLFALVGLRAAVVNLEYEFADLNRQKIDLVRESKMLAAQRASLYSARKIEDIATGRLGMQHPKREDVYFVKRSSGASAYKVSMESRSGGRAVDMRAWK